MKLSRFDFDLPKDRIAKYPADPRDSARLLKVSGKLKDHTVKDLPNLLDSDYLLVFNDTKVIPARLIGESEGIKAEVTLHKRVVGNTWQAFARPARKLREGGIFTVNDQFRARVTKKMLNGEIVLQFLSEDFDEKVHEYGLPPLPPYIKRNAEENDTENYQTIYAKNEGAVAAPTAGLHFTEDLFVKLGAKGIPSCFITLHVGAGTFLPVKTDNIKEHRMHKEYFHISKDTAWLINEHKAAGKKIVAVGTTSLRALEAATDATNILRPMHQETDIFIYPGYKFKMVDALLTNFHLPRSTLFMLVCAFAGEKRIKDAYSYAIENQYRFFSYGDAMLLFP